MIDTRRVTGGVCEKVAQNVAKTSLSKNYALHTFTTEKVSR
jgi:hypothetical protein